VIVDVKIIKARVSSGGTNETKASSAHPHPMPKMQLRFSPLGNSGLAAMLVLLLAAAHATKASASQSCPEDSMRLSKQPGYVLLEGHFCRGDGVKFVNYMASTGNGYSILRLNSGGGSGEEAVEIGRYIRAHAITTWTDGSRDRCASACNRVFAAGTKRIYSNADDIPSGKTQARRGLGFHHPNSNGDFQKAIPFYQQTIAPYIRQMLPPAAARWVIETDEGNLTHDMFWLNGLDAVRLGISTENKSPLP